MALKSATTTLTTIQMRRGLEEDFDPDQMTAGEWAVSTNKKYVRMCFMPGLCLRMATYEAFEKDMEEIRQILVEAQDIHAAIERWNYLAESYAHGGTGKREGEDTDNAKYYSEQAKKSADKAESLSDIGIMTTEKAGIGKPDGTTITVDEDGTMHSVGDGGASGDFASKAIYGDNAVSLGRKEEETVGAASIAFGQNVTASNRGAVAFGGKNISSGDCSFSAGWGNEAQATNAVSFGSSNKSLGNNSVSFGSGNVSVDSYSFSECCGNIALGYGSHAENCQNIAGAKYVFKIASYDAAAKTFTFDDAYTGFSEAFTALEVGSKLFIQNVKYINDALTYTVSAKGSDGKTVTVNESIPTSNFSVLFATIIKSGGNYPACHVEGRKNIALGNYSHAEGYQTEARGIYSHTEGSNTKATGDSSHAEGYNTQATGGQSHAEGNSTTARGDKSHAEGESTLAFHSNSHAEGKSTIAKGNISHAEGGGSACFDDCSHAEGHQTIAGQNHVLSISSIDKDNKKIIFKTNTPNFESIFGILKKGSEIYVTGDDKETNLLVVSSVNSSDYSVVVKDMTGYYNYYSDALAFLNILSSTSGGGYHSEGYRTVSAGRFSHAEGKNNFAYGRCSHAEGEGNIAYGDKSHAEGFRTTALDYQHALGHYNDTSKATGAGYSSGASSGTAFVIGNGTSSTASNAARIDYNGKLWCKQAYSSTGADYAELFEWADGNIDNEDRRGYFVTIDGKKIRKAESGDYILGIISGNPSVIGNTDMEWYGQFMRDEFGTFIKETYKETVKEPSVDEDGNVTEEEREVDVEFYRVNPDYDPDAPYTFRLDRPEWDAVGMLGVLPVCDDGTCEVGKFCRCAGGGIATLAEERGLDTYMVIERVTENIVSVVLK